MRCTKRIGVVLVAVTTTALAAPPRERETPQCIMSGASVEYQVKGSGGGFDVFVNPKVVTVLYFPSQLKPFIQPARWDFSMNTMARSVTLRPLNDQASGTLSFETVDDLHIAVALKPGPVDKAQAQVIFTSEKEENRYYEEEIQKRLLPITRRQVAKSLLGEFHAREVNGVARTDDNVIIRVSRSIVIGDLEYVYFTVENRSGDTHRLARIEVIQGGRHIDDRGVAFEPATEGAGIGTTVKGTTGRGILILPANEVKAGQMVEFGFIDGDRGEKLKMGARLE